MLAAFSWRALMFTVCGSQRRLLSWPPVHITSSKTMPRYGRSRESSWPSFPLYFHRLSVLGPNWCCICLLSDGLGLGVTLFWRLRDSERMGVVVVLQDYRVNRSLWYVAFEHSQYVDWPRCTSSSLAYDFIKGNRSDVPSHSPSWIFRYYAGGERVSNHSVLISSLVLYKKISLPDGLIGRGCVREYLSTSCLSSPARRLDRRFLRFPFSWTCNQWWRWEWRVPFRLSQGSTFELSCLYVCWSRPSSGGGLNCQALSSKACLWSYLFGCVKCPPI